MKVKFSLAEENKAVITGSSKGEVQLYTKEGKFFISLRLIKLENSDETQVTVYFRELQNLKVGQNSEVELLGKIEQSNIIFEAREGAILLAELKVENLSAYAITGGLLKISGNANTQNIEVRSKGIFRGEDLPGTNVKVTISGGGKGSY